MSKNDIVSEQKRRQQELIELKKQKEQFESNPEEYTPADVAVAAPQTFGSKLKNFWYYSRFAIVFTLICAIILTIGIAQCATRTQYDCTVVLYFKHPANSFMVENVATVMEKYCGDYNGDGEVNVLVMDCTMTDQERLTEAGQAKSTRLMVQFTNEEAIIYIVDKEALLDLDTVANGVFVDDSLALPEYDGKAYKLNGTVFDSAFDTVSEGYSKKMEYYIIRRVVSGTAIENNDKVGIYSKQADEIIGKIVANPTLNENNGQ